MPASTSLAARALAAVAVCAAAALAAGQGGAAGPPATPAERPHAQFAPASACAWCHSNAPAATAMRDPGGREVSPSLLWSGSVMASAFRDVIWRAAVEAEVANAPAREREIVALCIRCHAPMIARTLPAKQATLALLQPGRAGELAADGVSCTVCHRISPQGLGDQATFTGAFRLLEEDQLAGPHRDPFTRPMLHHSGFTPVHGAQLQDSGLCGTCHSVITVPLATTVRGAAFVQQATFLEWRNSAYAAAGESTGATCQACHAPTQAEDGAAIETRIARDPSGREFPPPIAPRAPYGRHVFAGANLLLPRLLGGAAAGPDEPPGFYDAAAALAKQQLEERTARLAIVGARIGGGKLSFVVRLANLTGHKFPTGHPARRAWLRVRVVDAVGRDVFASGEHDAAGRILGPSGAPLASEVPGGPHHPHRTLIKARDEVQVYELVMEDEQGAITERLLPAFVPRKDDRLLPAGWSPDHRDAPWTRPVGTDGDPDFETGRDGVTYEIPLPTVKTPLKVEVSLLYQTLSPRHAAELVRGDGEAARSLASSLARLGNAPVPVAVVRKRVR